MHDFEKAKKDKLTENEGHITSNRLVIDKLRKDFAEFKNKHKYVTFFEQAESQCIHEIKVWETKNASYLKDAQDLESKLNGMIAST